MRRFIGKALRLLPRRRSSHGTIKYEALDLALEITDLLAEKLPILQRGIRDGSLSEGAQEAAEEIGRLIEQIKTEAWPIWATYENCEDTDEL